MIGSCMAMNIYKQSHHVPTIHIKTETAQVEKAQRQAEKTQVENMQVKKQDVKNTVDKINEFIDPLQTNIRFVYHEDLNEYYVTVVNPVTDEVVREIPPKKILDMYAAMNNVVGIVVDESI